MQTKNFALLGYPLSHSLSPQIHEMLFAFSGVDAKYTLKQIPPEEFTSRCNELFELDGFNITIPYKVKIMEFLSQIDPDALALNSVNTVSCSHENVGYNTDVYGFKNAVEQMGVKFASKKVLLLGSGGSANMIASLAVQNDCELTIAVREGSIHKACALADRLNNSYSQAKINTCDINKIDGVFDILVNATPVGMYPNTDACPVSESVIANCDYIYDLIYNPLSTKLIKLSEKLGKTFSNGLSMLVLQAAHAHKIWYKAEFSEEQIAVIIDKMSEILSEKV